MQDLTITTTDIFKNVDFLVIECGYIDRISEKAKMQELHHNTITYMSDISSLIEFAWIGHSEKFASLTFTQEDNVVDDITTAILNGVSQQTNDYIVFNTNGKKTTTEELGDEYELELPEILNVIKMLADLDFCAFLDIYCIETIKRISFKNKNIIYISIDTESG